MPLVRHTRLTCIFYDTVLGNNSVACAGGSTNCSNATSGQFGVLVDPTATTKPAFITKTGYDNATGLGSLNVTNLLTLVVRLFHRQHGNYHFSKPDEFHPWG